MKDTKKLKIFIIIFLLVFGIVILTLSWPLLVGKTYVLKTRPVDPFDVLRGQYVIIGYEIGSISDVSIPESAKGDYVYVILETDSEGISRPKTATLDYPEFDDFIRGKIVSVNDNSINIEYGIEQFFFERGAKFSMINVTVEVKVDKIGKVRISQLLQNGIPLDIEYRDRGIYS